MTIAVYHNLSSGGAKRALQEITRRLAQRHTVDVFTLSSAEHDFGDVRADVRQHLVTRFDPWPLLRSPFGRMNQVVYTANILRVRAVQRAVAATIDASGYDVVMAHHCRFAQAPGLLEFLRTPSVYYCQEPPRSLYEPPFDRPYLRHGRLRQLVDKLDPLIAGHRTIVLNLDRRNTRAAKKVLVNSAYSADVVRRIYGGLVPAEVCYLGADLSRFKPLDLPRENLVLSVGALAPHKGYDFLIDALSRVPADKRPRLVIVCNQLNPPEHAFLSRLASALAVDVELRHNASDAELVRLYNTALFTVYTPYREPFGFVPIESMACGTPVVGVRDGGVSETIQHEHTGLLVERDAKSCAEAILRLLCDHELRRRLGAAGPSAVATRWDWNNTVAQVEWHLEAVTSRRR